MTEATMPVTVEQCDRDEAAALMQKVRGYSVRLPNDGHFAIQAFARHRLNTRATPPSPAGLAREQIARIIEPNAFGSDFGLPDATVSKLAALDKADRILTALTANGSQPDRVVDVRENERGWLIEETFGPHLHWIALEPGVRVHALKVKRTRPIGDEYEVEHYQTPLRRVKDANEALRFARKQDAEAFIALVDRFLLSPTVTEHEWPLDSKDQSND